MSSENKESKDDVFEVEQLLAERTRSKGKEFLVRWAGYSEADDTWEPEANILGDELVPKLALREWTWQFEVTTAVDGLSVGWHDFDKEMQKPMNTAYQAWLDKKGPKTLAVCRTKGKSTFHYTLNWENQTQRNETHADHTVRNIRRKGRSPQTTFVCDGCVI